MTTHILVSSAWTPTPLVAVELPRVRIAGRIKSPGADFNSSGLYCAVPLTSPFVVSSMADGIVCSTCWSCATCSSAVESRWRCGLHAQLSCVRTSSSSGRGRVVILVERNEPSLSTSIEVATVMPPPTRPHARPGLNLQSRSLHEWTVTCTLAVFWANSPYRGQQH